MKVSKSFFKESLKETKNCLKKIIPNRKKPTSGRHDFVAKIQRCLEIKGCMDF